MRSATDFAKRMRKKMARPRGVFGMREFIFQRDPMKKFVNFAMWKTKCFKQIICIAHNVKFYAQFILEHIMENRNNFIRFENNFEPYKNCNVINRTYKIHRQYINYMPLICELPKAFGLENTTNKSIFPHLFNTVQNQLYVGSLLHYYPENMKTEAQTSFLAWHTDIMPNIIAVPMTTFFNERV